MPMRRTRPQRKSEQDYQHTLNLPRTEFPMRANLPQREPAMLRRWQEYDLYRAVQERTQGRPRFILHDGPPFSNGDVHLGHALNKILKDFVVKFRSMQGFDAPFVPGWDTHGLPTEITAIRSHGPDRNAADRQRLRRHCAETALKYIDIQREQFIRLGVRGDWDHQYLTMQPEYEATVLEVFQRLVEAGLIYRGLKPVYWCTACETALAEAEIEFFEHEAHSIYVAFPAVQVDDTLFPGEDRTNMSAVIWTTTPWTLPANVAIAVHPEATYALVTDETDREGFTYIVARALVESFAKAVNMRKPRILGEESGRSLEGATFRHPLLDRQVPIILAEFVTLEGGSGLVHIAPAHGKEDFIAGISYGLPVVQPVGPSGIFGPEAGPFAGKVIYDAQEDILRRMDRDGTLLAHGTILHQYPHCWRCRGLVIMRATRQWFIALEPIREQVLATIPGVQWTPAWGRERMTGMVEDRPDWCISRQRNWGIPIPAFYCASCDEPLLSSQAIATFAETVRREGVEAWYTRRPDNFLPEGTTCPQCGGNTFTKETDIFDVWFDSGCSHIAVMQKREDMRWPADLYLEGHDQFRGWFQVSLLTAVGMGQAAPYREVLAHGFILDHTGRKQSKSLGNIINPQQVVREYGADILRLWVASADFRADLSMSEEAFAQVIEVYRRVRNTLRFLLGNLFDFDPKMARPVGELEEIDRWSLLRLNQLIECVTDAFTRYEFHIAYQAVNEFCAGDLSAFYLDVAKDWLYTDAPDSSRRRSTQTAFLHIAHILAQLLAPILSFTADEVWLHLPGERSAESVQLTDWPVSRPEWGDTSLGEKWSRFFAVRNVVNAALDQARSAGIISQPFSAKVSVFLAGESRKVLESLNTLAKLLLVSAVEVLPWEKKPAEAYTGALSQVAVEVSIAPGAQCPRCRIWRTTIGESAAHPILCIDCVTTVESLASRGDAAA